MNIMRNAYRIGREEFRSLWFKESVSQTPLLDFSGINGRCQFEVWISVILITIALSQSS